MDKDHKIWESSDSEFLSFLYAERDRENAMSAAWGINYWVVGAAVLGLLGYAYSQISANYEEFSWRLLIYYFVAIGAVVVAIATLVSPLLQEDRWKNSSHVTNVWKSFPFVDIYWKLFISYVSFCCLITFLHEFGLVMWLWVCLFAIEVGALVYAGKQYKKLILVDKRGYVFPNIKIEMTYRSVEVLICFAIVIAALLLWGGQYEIGIKEFEIACVSIIIIGIMWMTHSRIEKGHHRYVDKILDEYLYGTITKKDAFIYLYTTSQGNDIFDILHSEYKMAKSYGEYLDEHHGMHEQYLRMIKEGTLVYEECEKYVEEVNRDASLAKKALDMAENLQETLSDVIRLKATSSVGVEMVRKKMEEMDKLQDDLIRYAKENIVIKKALEEYIESYMCRKTRCLCDQLDCARRKDRFSVAYWVQRKWKERKI